MDGRDLLEGTGYLLGEELVGPGRTLRGIFVFFKQWKRFSRVKNGERLRSRTRSLSFFCSGFDAPLFIFEYFSFFYFLFHFINY